ncbi:hypothetical protein TWF718_002977 [Orbilia javanica]|uniref:F-box domain-containing protein n=1 Tax=Orbilia javanica TaxID=47235 RepID=A0AAN8MJ69_9PEZI
MPPRNILLLPTELQSQILLALSIVDQVSASETCTLWKEILLSKSSLQTRYPSSDNIAIPPIHQLLGGPILSDNYPSNYLRCVVNTKTWNITAYEIGPYGKPGYERTHEWRQEMLNDGPSYITQSKFLDELVLSPFMQEPFDIRLKKIHAYYGPDVKHKNDLWTWFLKNDIFLTSFWEKDGKYECPLVNVAILFPYTEARGYLAPTPLIIKRLNLTPELTIRTMVEKIALNIGKSLDKLQNLKSMLPETIKLAFAFNKESVVLEQTWGWGLHCSLFFSKDGI